jgi:hypothetical protein
VGTDFWQAKPPTTSTLLAKAYLRKRRRHLIPAPET